MAMFGYVRANIGELDRQAQERYNAVYCGICRRIRDDSSNLARLGLQYDMAFLALLLMSLYEPEEAAGDRACMLHPIKPKAWVDSEYIAYAADMNVALAYYKAMDDAADDRSLGAKAMAGVFGKKLRELTARWPRQCRAMQQCIGRLSALERENCPNPDEPAACFGELMAQLFICREDLWAQDLYQMGMALGRFIYLADAAVDYRHDRRRGRYNPFLAMGMAEDWDAWEQYLLLALGRCTDAYERLPLVQDKNILDNILYSGVWAVYRGQQEKQREKKDDR